jgi:hypothetical protein
MKYKIGDKVSLTSKSRMWDGYGFEDSVVTNAFEVNGIPKYSLKSKNGHTISTIEEKRLSIKKK